jgi:hypothetical protein
MIKQSGLVSLMSKDDAKNIVDRIDSLNQYWTPRPRNGLNMFYTMGAAGYLDTYNGARPNQYSDLYNKINPILKENFSDLYELLINKLNTLVGKCELADNLAFPGFQIFGLKKEHMDNIIPIPNIGYSTELHSDKVSYNHKSYWDKYKEVEEDMLTITVAFEIHKNGSGLVVWDKDMDIDSNTEYANAIKKESMDILRTVKEKSGYPFNENKISEFDMEYPKIVEYYPGSMFYVIGDPWHQVASPINAMSNERRITLQAHALKCDGIWRLHF